MSTYVSMIRGINVSGQKRVLMEDLRRSYGSLGFQDVKTYVQSGNVVFGHPGTDAVKVTGEIERNLKRSFGFDAVVVVRTKDELEELVEENPFTGKDESKLHVTFLSGKPVSFPSDEVRRAKDKAEEFSASAREVYLFCPNGYGNTKLSNNFFERKLKVSATTRNWRTVNTLLSMASERVSE